MKIKGNISLEVKSFRWKKMCRCYEPEAKDTKNAASPLPSFLRGPKLFSVANNGKYTTEKETSRNIVAPMPLYKPIMPFSRSSCKAI